MADAILMTVVSQRDSNTYSVYILKFYTSETV